MRTYVIPKRAVSEATVPRLSVIVRKAYGAGLYAMSGPGFDPEACLALPSAMIAVMGPEAAVNAVYYNKLQGLGEAERRAEEAKLRQEYREDIDIERLASELVVDAVVPPESLRDEVVARLRAARGRRDRPPAKRRSENRLGRRPSPGTSLPGDLTGIGGPATTVRSRSRSPGTDRACAPSTAKVSRPRSDELELVAAGLPNRDLKALRGKSASVSISPPPRTGDRDRLDSWSILSGSEAATTT